MCEEKTNIGITVANEQEIYSIYFYAMEFMTNTF